LDAPTLGGSTGYGGSRSRLSSRLGVLDLDGGGVILLMSRLITGLLEYSDAVADDKLVVAGLNVAADDE